MTASQTSSGAFYIARDDGRFASTGRTRGPWSADSQHGGPPMALLGSRMALLAPPGSRATRLTYDILRPVGVVPLRVETRLVRAGQVVAWIEGAIFADPGIAGRGEVEVMRARGVWVRARAGESASVGEGMASRAEVPPPEAGTRFMPADWGLAWDEGYHTAMELVNVPSAHPERVAWLRALDTDLVAGQAWTPLGRLLVAVDSIGGANSKLSWSAWTFVNAETSCHLLREVEGEWVALVGTQWVESDGIGLAEAVLCDRRGPLGRGLQSQVVAPRAR